MHKYELTVILEPKLKKEEKDELVGKIKSWVEKEKGKVYKEKDWGIKELAYPIRKQKEALYYFFELEALGNLDKIFQEQVELESKILRYFLVRQDK